MCFARAGRPRSQRICADAAKQAYTEGAAAIVEEMREGIEPGPDASTFHARPNIATRGLAKWPLRPGLVTGRGTSSPGPEKPPTSPAHLPPAPDAPYRSRKSRASVTNCSWNWKMPP
ncbi:hypothetical protein SALBM311S_02404 [Streptomyces alboniger]